MFVVQALYPFSAVILKQQQQAEPKQQKTEQQNEDHAQQSEKHSQNQSDHSQENKGQQSQHQQQKPQNVSVVQQVKGEKQQVQDNQNQQSSQIAYLSFQKGDKILVMQSYETGWWYGHTIKQPDINGFFPSNYIQLTTRPKPPPPPSEPLPQEDSDNPIIPTEQRGIEWVQNELKNITQGPVKSDYYLGIKSYKNVKINDNNQNVLKGDHVKFDVSTGLAKVPVKDQAPMAKAVRQMGYYFDYHQWNQERNKDPGQRARPDPKKKKIKKLNLKGMK